MQYLVARFEDGRVFKGRALGLDFASGTFRVDVTSGPGETGPAEFQTADLKALFGVADLDGDPKRADWTALRTPGTCENAIVRFKDGEVMVGVIPEYEPGSDFFYLVPADPLSNNVWCYVRAAATEEVRLLPPGTRKPGPLTGPGVGRAVARVISLSGLSNLRHL
jgi:hypothetical protein